MRKTLLLLPILFITAGCDKSDETGPPASPTKTQILTQASWKFENVGIDDDKNGTIDTDLSSQIRACAKDNTLKFETNGTGTADEGAIMCSNSSGQTTPFNWVLLSNENVLSITGDAVLGYGGQYKLVSLSDTRMSLAKDTTLGSFGTHTMLANFIH